MATPTVGPIEKTRVQTPGARHQTPGNRKQAPSTDRQAQGGRCCHCRRSLDRGQTMRFECVCVCVRLHLFETLVWVHCWATQSLCWTAFLCVDIVLICCAHAHALRVTGVVVVMCCSAFEHTYICCCCGGESSACKRSHIYGNGQNTE